MISDEARKLGEALVTAKILTAEQLQVAVEEATRPGAPSLVVILLDKGFLTFKVFEKYVTKTAQIRPAILADHVPDKNLIQLIGEDLIQSQFVFPIASRDDRTGKTLALGMVDPLDHKTAEKIQSKTGHRVVPFLISLPDFKRAVEKLPKRVEVKVDTDTEAAKEEFIVIRPGGFEEQMGAPETNSEINSQAVLPKPQWESERPGGTHSHMFVKNQQKLQVDLMGANKSKFREEILAKLDLAPAEARRLTEKRYTREILYSHLNNVSPAELQKVYNTAPANLRVEALTNVLIRAGVITKNDMLISTAVSVAFNEETEA